MSSESDDIPTYSEMFSEYLGTESHWIKPADLPLVHHIRNLCRQLDGDGTATAALASAYLQAVERLNKRRPGATPVAGDLPGQRSIFDELD